MDDDAERRQILEFLGWLEGRGFLLVPPADRRVQPPLMGAVTSEALLLYFGSRPATARQFAGSLGVYMRGVRRGTAERPGEAIRSPETGGGEG